MVGDSIEIQVKGKAVRVPCACINGRTVITAGRAIKIASIMDEQLLDGETVGDPEIFIAQLRQTSLKADIFTFVQKLPDVVPKHKYHLEWDNAAVIPITSYSNWLESRVEYDVRKAIKRAKRLGVVVEVATFDDAFVEGIRGIYNESPVRQGKAFWHYQKNFATVKRENSTYLDRSGFIGAYCNGELIGFIRMVYVDTIATTLQVITQKKHFDKKPMNALIAKAVEVCEQKGLSHFVYGSYIYTDANSSLTEFKRRNGFEEALIPRYYIPLTWKGGVALKLNLHRQLAGWIPQPVSALLRSMRNRWRDRQLRSIAKSS